MPQNEFGLWGASNGSGTGELRAEHVCMRWEWGMGQLGRGELGARASARRGLGLRRGCGCGLACTLFLALTSAPFSNRRSAAAGWFRLVA
jgi:hypothetical protein